MAGILISLAVVLGMFAAIQALARMWFKQPGQPLRPGHLSEAERRRLYQRLGIDPALLGQQRHGRRIWSDQSRTRTRA